MIKFGVIGCGNMANAIIRGAFKGMGNKISFLGYDIDSKKTDKLCDVGLKSTSTAGELVAESDYILFSVKPQNFAEMIKDLKDIDCKGKVFISIMAGVTAKSIKDSLGFDAKVVLVMPNTPLLLSKGATAMARVLPTTEEEFNFVKEIFSCAGVVCEIPDDKLCEVIPVNGSSPAFLYEFAKGFIEYGEKNGIGYDTSLKLFCQAMRGAADMMEFSENSIDELITMVSSKGGTTIEGLKALKEGNLQDTISDCCEKCVKRAYELSK